jgi:ABC-2 type transport system permease protein
MSTTAPTRPELGTGGVTQARVIKSEWIKLRSLRSTWWSLFATFVFIVGLGVLVSAIRAHNFNQGFTGTGGPHAVIIRNGRRIVVKPTFGPPFDPIQVSLRGVYLAQLAIGVLGSW